MRDWVARLQVLAAISIISSILSTYTSFIAANEPDAVSFLSISDYVDNAIGYSIVFVLIALFVVFSMTVIYVCTNWPTFLLAATDTVAHAVEKRSTFFSRAISWTVWIALFALLSYSAVDQIFFKRQSSIYLIGGAVGLAVTGIVYLLYKAVRKYSFWNVATTVIFGMSFLWATVGTYALIRYHKSANTPNCRVVTDKIDNYVHASKMERGIFLFGDGAFSFVPWDRVSYIECRKEDFVSKLLGPIPNNSDMSQSTPGRKPTTRLPSKANK